MDKWLMIAIFLVSSVGAYGQTRTFTWDDELCGYSGTYDAKKYSEEQLRNTLKLGQTAGSYPIETNTTAWKISDIPTLDVAALDREYQQRSAELKAMPIVPVPYWQTFKLRKIRELDQVYRLARVSMVAYEDPRALLSYEGARSCMVPYARPLVSGGEDLLIAWRGVNEASRARNSDPEGVRRKYEEQLRSPDKMLYAQIEVITFGWGNCANDLIDYVKGDQTPNKEFKKLFKSVKTVSCDEP